MDAILEEEAVVVDVEDEAVEVVGTGKGEGGEAEDARCTLVISKFQRGEMGA